MRPRRGHEDKGQEARNKPDGNHQHPEHRHHRDRIVDSLGCDIDIHLIDLEQFIEHRQFIVIVIQF
jgi:hypothetical protein